MIAAGQRVRELSQLNEGTVVGWRPWYDPDGRETLEIEYEVLWDRTGSRTFVRASRLVKLIQPKVSEYKMKALDRRAKDARKWALSAAAEAMAGNLGNYGINMPLDEVIVNMAEKFRVYLEEGVNE